MLVQAAHERFAALGNGLSQPREFVGRSLFLSSVVLRGRGGAGVRRLPQNPREVYKWPDTMGAGHQTRWQYYIQ